MARRALRWFVGALLVLLMVVVVGGVWFIRRPWPQTEGTLTLEGLQAPVTVLRDAHGIPYIYAENEHDLFFAQGYVHAQDRLWQMDFQRRVGLGRLSEILGEATLETDMFLRTVGTNRAAQRDYENASDATKAILQAYADGVNAYIATHRGRYPLEYRILGVEPEPWSPVDTLAWAKMMQWDLTNSFRSELLYAQLLDALGPERAAELFPGYTPGALTILREEDLSLGTPDFEAVERALAKAGLLLDGVAQGWGSNNWVVAPSRSETGRPLLANDPHLAFGTPAIWYLMALHAPTYNSTGATLPGIPGVVIGHNERIAWGMTNLAADVMDLYIERLNPDNPNEYEVNGEYVPFEIVREEIRVKGRAEPVVVDVKLSRHGPLVNDVLDLEQPVAMQWLATAQPNTLIDAMYPVNTAQNWDEFRAALQNWDAPMQNFVYADVDGNIGYYGAGKVPIRANGVGDTPVPGWTDEYEWVDFIPFDELPHTFNPARGYVATANHKPVPDSYPYYISTFWSTPNRARRIEEGLTAKERLSLDDMAAIQADIVSIPAQQIVPHLLAVQTDDIIARRAQDALREWDYRLDADSAAAGIFEVAYWKLIEATVADDLPEALRDDYLAQTHRHYQFMEWLLQQPADNAWWDDQTTPEQETRDDIMARALAATVEWWGRQQGDLVHEWTWGRLHTTTFKHNVFGDISPLNRFFNVEAGPTPGDNQTPNANSFAFGDSFAVRGGPGYRELFDVGNWDASRVVITVGQSGHVFHPHYGDFAPMWLTMEYAPLPWTREAVEAAATKRLELRPQQ